MRHQLENLRSQLSVATAMYAHAERREWNPTPRKDDEEKSRKSFLELVTFENYPLTSGKFVNMSCIFKVTIEELIQRSLEQSARTPK